MCLENLTRKKPNNRTVVKGFKVLCLDNSNELVVSNQGTKIVSDRWMKATGRPLPTENEEKHYPSGFHIWATIQAAEAWVGYTWRSRPSVVPVKGRNVRAIGKTM